jgi:hypothetical protein
MRRQVCVLALLLVCGALFVSAAMPQRLSETDLRGGQCYFRCSYCQTQNCHDYDSTCQGGGATCFGTMSLEAKDCLYLNFDCYSSQQCRSYVSCLGC